ncbi:hypothetical protein E9934_19170, partial [Nocardioides caeni]
MVEIRTSPGPKETPMPITETQTRLDIDERNATAVNGWPALLGVLLLWGGAVVLFSQAASSDIATSTATLLIAGGIAAALAGAALASGLTVVAPGETRVVVFFGNYLGTIRRTGLSLTVPFTGRSKVPVRILNFETATIKVNERNGSPVQVSAIVVWQVKDTAKAHFAVDDYHDFIESQSESALRQVVARHPYDHQTERMAAVAAELAEADTAPASVPAAPSDPTGQGDVTTLREDGELVADELAAEVNARVHLAGLDVLEVRLSNLSYAPEIAAAMLQRQQAQAVLDARRVVI